MQIKSTTVAAIIAFVASLGAATMTINEYRWWPWRGEFEEVAITSLQTAINQKWDQLIFIERQLKQCQTEGADCTGLLRQQQRLRDEIKELEIKRDKYQSE